MTAFDWNTTYWPQITSAMLHHSAQYRNNNSTLVLSHMAASPPGIIWFSFRRFLWPLTCQIQTLCSVFQSGFSVQHCKWVGMYHVFCWAGWYDSQKCYCTTIIFSVFWCRVVVFSELCNNAILPVQCNVIGRTGMDSLPRFVNYKPLQCRYSPLQRNSEQHNTNPMQ